MPRGYSRITGLPIRLGRTWKASAETRERMSVAQRKLAAENPERWKASVAAAAAANRGHPSWNKSKKGHTAGDKHWTCRQGGKRPDVSGENHWSWGKRRPEMSGANHPNWRGGITSENGLIRISIEYRRWRAAVFVRDDYTCQLCGKVGGPLNADHIKPFCKYPELRFDLDNGRTLCRPCHRQTPTYGNKARKYVEVA